MALTFALRKSDIDQIIIKLPKGSSRAEKNLVRKAYFLAADAHKYQKRLSGEPYIIHPVGVATLLSELGMDYESVCAGLLHDVLEDTETTKSYIAQEFGETVSHLIEGVTKISLLKNQSHEAKQAANIRKIILATAKDVRVIIIKLADKLHNMRTLQHHNSAKATVISQEVIDIYAPLAGRLGIYSYKWELEDIALSYIDPGSYKEIKNYVSEKRSNRDDRITALISILESNLKRNKIKARILGRSKHFYSIFKKSTESQKSLQEIFDLSGIRIILDNDADCFLALGYVHSLWAPVPGRFKDYISVPKSNSYQSLHTTVVAPDGDFLEVQIRSRFMHYIAEYGVAAHWNYKSKEPISHQFKEKTKDLFEDFTIDNDDAASFLDEFKKNLSVDEEVYVFTPKGEIISMPAGSTVLDFAFRIHSEIGLQCSGAKIGERLVSLRTPIQSGEQIRVITNKSVQPSQNWLTFLKTAGARAKLRNYLKKDQSTLPSSNVMEREPKKRPAKTDVANIEQKVRKPVYLAGYSEVDYKFAKCCDPYFPTPIIGFITLGRTVSIHAQHCHFVKNTINKNNDSSRFIEGSWGEPSSPLLEKIIVIEATDRSQLYLDLVSAFAFSGANILEATAKKIRTESVEDRFTIQADNEDHLKDIIREIKNVNGVISVNISPKA
jgi:GTP diphosphokinase / guanosine-3',5'-bis(diphosphate) 3'-diphosphatase